MSRLEAKTEKGVALWIEQDAQGFHRLDCAWPSAASTPAGLSEGISPMADDFPFLQDSAIAESKGGQLLLKWLREAERNEKLAVDGEALRFELVKSPEFAQWVRLLDMDGQRWLAIAMTFALAKRDKQSPAF